MMSNSLRNGSHFRILFGITTKNRFKINSNMFEFWEIYLAKEKQIPLKKFKYYFFLKNYYQLNKLLLYDRFIIIDTNVYVGTYTVFMCY